MPRWRMNPQQITGWLQEMVSIDSVNPGLVPGAAGEAAIAAWLAQTCRDLGLEVQLQDTAPGRPNVLALWKGRGGGRSLLLTGHTDVVSVENMQGDPFSAHIEDGRLYGRGALDMKGGLAGILGAVAALRAAGFTPSGDIWLGFVTDEEYLSIGTEALVTAIRPDAAILTEPTDLRICTGHKGFIWLTFTTHGRAAHGSRYAEGRDAIAYMGRVLVEMEHFEREVLPGRNHPLLGRPSTHASVIKGGLGLSTYPDQCTLTIEHRLLPGDHGADVLATWQERLNAMTAADPSFSASVTLDFERPGYEIAHDAPVVAALYAACQSVTGVPPEYMGMSAWLDAYLLGAAGIPTVTFGPGGAGLHSAVEYVILEDVHRCAEILAETAANWTA